MRKIGKELVAARKSAPRKIRLHTFISFFWRDLSLERPPRFEWWLIAIPYRDKLEGYVSIGAVHSPESRRVRENPGITYSHLIKA